ncbi:MAG: tetratricopeptide repeat protein [Syntrophales bacterium]|nr:tetratricopeptide repeat protein [Syntrophales bacterium]
MDTSGFNDREVFIVRTDILLAQGSYEEARALSRERLTKFSDDPDAMMVLCRASLEMDNLDEARAALDTLERLHLQLVRIYKDMGDAYLRRDMDREALDCFRKGMILLPEAGDVGQISRTMAEALSAFDKSDREEADHDGLAHVMPDFYTLTMADLYLKQGHVEMALEVLEAIGSREPENELVRERLEQLKAEMSRQPGMTLKTPQGAVLDELERWLNNIGRIRPFGENAGRNA